MEENNKVIGIAEDSPERKTLDSINTINFKINELNYLVYAVLFLTFFAMLGILCSYLSLLADNWNHKEDAYYRLIDKIDYQNNCKINKIK